MKKILLNIGFDYFTKGRTGVGAYQSNIIWGLKCDYDIIDNLYNEVNKIIEEGITTDQLSGFSFQTEYFKAMKKTGNYGRSIRV